MAYFPPGLSERMRRADDCVGDVCLACNLMARLEWRCYCMYVVTLLSAGGGITHLRVTIQLHPFFLLPPLLPFHTDVQSLCGFCCSLPGSLHQGCLSSFTLSPLPCSLSFFLSGLSLACLCSSC